MRTRRSRSRDTWALRVCLVCRGWRSIDGAPSRHGPVEGEQLLLHCLETAESFGVLSTSRLVHGAVDPAAVLRVVVAAVGCGLLQRFDGRRQHEIGSLILPSERFSAGAVQMHRWFG